MVDQLNQQTLKEKLGGRNIFLIGMMGSGKSQTGPDLAKIVNYAFVDTDTIGGGLFNMPVSVMLWDIWSNPVSDCTNVWFSIDPPEAGVIIGEAKTGNNNPDTGNSYPGVAWTTMQWSSMQVFEMPFINAQTYGIDQNGYPTQLTISSEDNIIAYQNPIEGASLTIQPILMGIRMSWCLPLCCPVRILRSLRPRALAWFLMPRLN